MRNYLVCYYILQQCMFETLEEDLSELLQRISPELWEGGTCTDPVLHSEWEQVLDCTAMTEQEMQTALSRKLTGEGKELQKTIKVIQGENFAYYLAQAKERAEEWLEEQEAS